MSTSDPNPPNNNYCIDILIAVAVGIGAGAWGAVVSYSSMAINSLEESAVFSNMTLNEISWFTSLVPLAACISCIFTGYLSDILGRRGIIMLSTLPYLIGCLLIGFAYNNLMLYGGRIFTGIVTGTLSTIGPVYINETSSKLIRGKLIILHSILMHIGILYSYVAGYYLPYDYLSLSLISMPIIMLGFLIFLPESPRYLISKGRISQAMESLQSIRKSKSNNVKQEFEEMLAGVISEENQKISTLKLIRIPSLYKPSLICMILMIFQVGCGVDAVTFYSYTIFKESGANISVAMSTIIIGISQLVALFPSIFIVDRFGRRPLLIFSEIAMLISLFILGWFFYFQSKNLKILEYFNWVPLVTLIFYSLTFSMGVGPCVWIYMEVIPNNIRGLVSGVVIAVKWGFAFIITKYFGIILVGIGGEWCFWTFSFISFLGSIFIYYFVPETKGKTLEEIQSLFI